MNTPAAPPTRLDQLRNMRDQIDQEIEREVRTLRRLRTLSVGAKVIATTRVGFSEQVIAVTAAHYGLTVDDITGRDRGALVAAARAVAAWVLHEAGRSYPEIGRALGGRDHSTALYAVRRVNNTPQLATIAGDVRHQVLGPDPDHEEVPA